MKGKRFLALLLSAVMTMSMGIPAAAAENSEETLENQVLYSGSVVKTKI